MKMHELKPCPFCGGEACIEIDVTSGIKRFLPVCSKYGNGCWGMQENWFFTEQEAIEAWNGRVNNDKR